MTWTRIRHRIGVIERICNDAHARRELLWLDAHAHGDARDAESLEALDPGIEARLARLYDLRPDLAGLESSEARRARFCELWDLHFAYLELRLG